MPTSNGLGRRLERVEARISHDYCPSYGDYYPNVQSCPDPWVPEPAS
jgi:hypothetical protein